MQFSAHAVPAGTWLEWRTASEQHNAGFTVERSVPGADFVAVGHLIPGYGTTASQHTYSFLDADPPLESVLYYRLRQTDDDGSTTFSTVVPVAPLLVNALQVSPVPAQDELFVAGIPLNATVTLWNANGQALLRQQVQGTRAVLHVSQLPSGLYHVQVGTQHARFVKQ